MFFAYDEDSKTAFLLLKKKKKVKVDLNLYIAIFYNKLLHSHLGKVDLFMPLAFRL